MQDEGRNDDDRRFLMVRVQREKEAKGEELTNIVCQSEITPYHKARFYITPIYLKTCPLNSVSSKASEPKASDVRIENLSRNSQ